MCLRPGRQLGRFLSFPAPARTPHWAPSGRMVAATDGLRRLFSFPCSTFRNSSCLPAHAHSAVSHLWVGRPIGWRRGRRPRRADARPHALPQRPACGRAAAARCIWVGMWWAPAGCCTLALLQSQHLNKFGGARVGRWVLRTEAATQTHPTNNTHLGPPSHAAERSRRHWHA